MVNVELTSGTEKARMEDDLSSVSFVRHCLFVSALD